MKVIVISGRAVSEDLFFIVLFLKALLDPFDVRSSGYSFLEEMAWKVSRAGFSIAEVPIIFEQRQAGSSKIESREIYLAAWKVLVTALRK